MGCFPDKRFLGQTQKLKYKSLLNLEKKRNLVRFLVNLLCCLHDQSRWSIDLPARQPVQAQWRGSHWQACLSVHLSDMFSHIVVCLETCVTLAYSEPCHVQNFSIFKTWNIFRTLSRHILVYSEHWLTLAYRKSCHIQNFVASRTLANLGP